MSSSSDHGAPKDLLSIICHDLKDPLSSIVMGAGYLKKTVSAQDNPSAARVIDAVARAAERMSHTIGDFHDLARLEAGRLILEKQSHDLVTVARAAAEPMRDEAAKRGLELALPPPDREARITCDRGRVVQALTKVVQNAIKFTAEGGRIAVGVERTNGAVLVRVRDTGRGIAPERLPTIFDRDANARQMPREGLGLGLAIAKGLVELHGGRIAAESTLGQGTTVELRFPTT